MKDDDESSLRRMFRLYPSDQTLDWRGAEAQAADDDAGNVWPEADNDEFYDQGDDDTD